MRLLCVLINVMFSIIANGVDGQSMTENSDTSNNLLVAAPEPFNQGSPFRSGYNVAALDPSNQDLAIHSDHNSALDNENGVSGDSLSPDALSGMSDSISLSDSSNCVGNLGKRQDSGFTLGNYSFPKTPIFCGQITKKD